MSGRINTTKIGSAKIDEKVTKGKRSNCLSENLCTDTSCPEISYPETHSSCTGFKHCQVRYGVAIPFVDDAYQTVCFPACVMPVAAQFLRQLGLSILETVERGGEEKLAKPLKYKEGKLIETKPNLTESKNR